MLITGNNVAIYFLKNRKKWKFTHRKLCNLNIKVSCNIIWPILQFTVALDLGHCRGELSDHAALLAKCDVIICAYTLHLVNVAVIDVHDTTHLETM
jgi:hypothetical protein